MRKPYFLEDRIANRFYELPGNNRVYSIGRAPSSSIQIENPRNIPLEEMTKRERILVGVAKNQGRIQHREDGKIIFSNDSSHRVYYKNVELPDEKKSEEYVLEPYEDIELRPGIVLRFGRSYEIVIWDYNKGQERIRKNKIHDTQII